VWFFKRDPGALGAYQRKIRDWVAWAVKEQ
jgi:hypothetical protein